MLYTYLLCRCIGGSIEFEPGWCFTCGRSMRLPDPAEGIIEDGYTALFAAIEATRRKLDVAPGTCLKKDEAPLPVLPLKPAAAGSQSAGRLPASVRAAAIAANA